MWMCVTHKFQVWFQLCIGGDSVEELMQKHNLKVNEDRLKNVMKEARELRWRGLQSIP